MEKMAKDFLVINVGLFENRNKPVRVSMMEQVDELNVELDYLLIRENKFIHEEKILCTCWRWTMSISYTG
jgi:hypothetical protein